MICIYIYIYIHMYIYVAGQGVLARVFCAPVHDDAGRFAGSALGHRWA